MTMATPLLELTGLSVSYGGMRALSDVNLVIPEGSVVALLGANGAGKTTTLRTISGLIRPDGGKIQFRGRSIERTAPHRIASMGVMHVPEGRGIFRSLTVAENLEMAEYGRRAKTEGPVIEQAVAQFPALGSRLKQTAGTLSGGEQQMLALARAFAAKPALLMLDEISMGLAPLITEKLFEAIRAVAATGVGMLLIEQYVDAALELADYGYVLEKGRIVDMGDAGDLRAGDALAAAYLGAAL
ncbi:MAG TPA: ABC transporter ATP-binding protein [Mycobacteriales bacterium]|nr:ABC transporter ATP-binding protein [Mycobacteriales bacterium]